MIKNLIEKLKSNLEKSKYFAVLISLVAVFIIFLLSLGSTYKIFELKLYDLRFRMKPTVPQWNALTFLNMDDSSIKNVGQFPWPRYVYADGLSVLEYVGARQVTFDIQFMDESPILANKAKYKEFLRANRQNLTTGEFHNIVIDNDQIFADALHSYGKAVLNYSFLKEKISDAHLDKKTRQERREAYQLFLKKASIPVPEKEQDKYKGLIDHERVQIDFPIPKLIRSVEHFGFVDSDFDIDGTSRKIRLVRMFEGRLFLHMALVQLLDLCQAGLDQVIVDPGKNITIKNAINPITITKEDIEIPINEQGMLYINWAGRFEKTFNHLPFYALLEYAQVKDEIHAFYDEEEIRSGKTDRSSLYGKLERAYSSFNSEKDINKKRELWQSIIDTKKKIAEIEAGYAKLLKDEAAKIETELKNNPEPQLETVLADYKNFVKATKIVSEVEKQRDKSLVIGYTATATFDVGVTPLSSEYVMVGSYPNIINTILQKEYIKKANPFVNIIIMVILAVVIGLVLQQQQAMHSIITLISSFIVINGIIILIFAFGNIWIDELGISLALLLPGLAIVTVKFVSEESQKRFIKSAFSQYLSPKVIDQIIKDPESLKLGGANRDITIYFSDVAGFSGISEKLTPPQLVQLLNEYLSEMTEIILSYDGTIDKYEGDAIMAFWGAPQHYDDHAVRACLAAIDMKKRLAELREIWKAAGKDELKVRMGMNSGDAVVGNMGSRVRMDYTAMGDAVNLASRLEGANKFYSTYAMISESTYEMAKDKIEARQLDLIRVVGKEEPIKVFELLGKKGELPDYMNEMLEIYYQGLEHFQNRDWTKARTQFRNALKIVEDDGPSLTYVDRCTEFKTNPPPKNWDGVYKLKSK